MKNTSIKKKILILTAVVLSLLCIPLAGMQLTSEINWTSGDFLSAFLLLFGSGTVYLLVSRGRSGMLYRSALSVFLLSGLFLIWANGAVGLIGSENNMINLAYYAVILFGISGGALSRFKAKGMKYTLAGMAFTQAVITLCALLSGAQHLPHSSVAEILYVNGFFVSLYLISALLFRQADHYSGQTAAERAAMS